MAEIFSFDFYFAYGQFFVYDTDCGIEIAGLSTVALNLQGFSRNKMSVAFGTFPAFGTAPLRIFDRPMKDPSLYDRVITVPVFFSSGLIEIRGVEDSIPQFAFRMPPGHYSVTAAQAIIEPSVGDSEARIMIDLYFEKLEVPLTKSTILVADSMMKVSDVLIGDDLTT